MAETFTTDLARRVIKSCRNSKLIKSCRNSKGFGPDKLSILHLKHLGPRDIEYITALFNLSVTTCHISAILKSSLIIPIPKSGKDPSVGTSYRPISLLYPAAKVLESLILPTINKYLHLYVEAKMLKVREHSELLSAQYLARCLEPGNVCHSITTRENPKRRMKETRFTRHCNTVEPMRLADNRKATLQAIHTDAVNKAVKDQKNNIVLDYLPHPINE